MTPNRQPFGVLVTYRRQDLLAARLRQLADDDFALAQLVVVDNSPDDQSRAAVAEYALRRAVHHIETSENLGPAGGFARGMSYLLERVDDDDWIVGLNDDDLPERSWLRELFVECQRATESTTDHIGAVGLVGARYQRATGLMRRLRDDELVGVVEVDCLGGNQWPIYRARALRAAGVQRADLFFGFEELEQGLRIRRNGYKLVVPGQLMSEVRACFGSPGRKHRSTERTPDREWRIYYSTRNLIVIAREHGRWPAPLVATARFGVIGPLVQVASGMMTPRGLRLAIRGALDGWSGKMGRTIEPAQYGHK